MNLLIGAIVAIVVVGGGTWYAVEHPMHSASSDAALSATSTASADTDTDASTSASLSGSASISALAARGQDLRCEVSVDNPTSPASGTLLVSGGKVHGEFDTTTSGRTIHSSMISDGAYMYAWSNLAPQGVKVAVGASASSQASSGVDTNTQVRYSCEPWKADASAFVPPTNITFMTFGGVQ